MTECKFKSQRAPPTSRLVDGEDDMKIIEKEERKNEH